MDILEKLDDESIPLKDIIKSDEWLTTDEVAKLFGVKPRTVNRWMVEKFPKVKMFKTPGGHLRFYKPDVMIILEQYEDNANRGI